MKQNIQEVCKRNADDVRNISRELTEKALAMRCASYLAHAKAQLLTKTIFEIDQRKKLLERSNVLLRDKVDIISTQKADLEKEVQERKRIQGLLEEREREVMAAKEAAERANDAKSSFLAHMSHELRTPFHGILGAMSLAHSRMLDPIGKELLDKANASAEHLLEIINDILDISKIEASRLELESTDFTLMPIQENLVNLLGQKAKQKGIEFKIEIPPQLIGKELIGDRTRLAQVLINLASNAVKFTEYGCVTVRMYEIGILDIGLKVRFEVEDTGIGIESEDKIRLFNAFEQADSSITRKYGGTGLGLAISQHLVNLMGGKIFVESTCGKGSTFWFEIVLPISHRAELTVLPSRELFETILRREHSGKRVLLAEDDEINQTVAEIMLGDVGLVLDIAANGEVALQLASLNYYDLILMDMHMPVMNGVNAAKSILSNSLNTKTPILAMTANAFADEREQCFASGMLDHIPKPVKREELYETILKWLSYSDRNNTRPAAN